MANSTIFESQILQKSIPYAVECIATMRNWVILGTKDGKIVVYQFDTHSPGCDGNRDSHIVHIETCSTSRSCTVTALIPLPDQHNLWAVYSHSSMSTVNLYHFSDSVKRESVTQGTFSTLVSTISGIKDVIDIHAKKQRGIYSFAILQRKRIDIYQYEESTQELKRLFEYVPSASSISIDGALSVKWAGRNLIISTKQGYLLYNPFTATMDVLAPSTSSINHILLCTHPVPELLVTADDKTVRRVLYDGSAVPGESDFQWSSSSPKCVMYCHPYILSAHTDTHTVEVRMPLLTTTLEKMRPPSLVCQRFMDFPASVISRDCLVDMDATASRLSEESQVAVVAGKDVHLLIMYPLDVQVMSLASNGYLSVSQLLMQICQGGVSDRDLPKYVLMLSAIHEFRSGNYRLSMQHLSEAGADVRVALLLYPQLVSDEMRDSCFAAIPPQIQHLVVGSLSSVNQSTGTGAQYQALIDYLRAKRPLLLVPNTEKGLLENDVLRCVDTSLLKAYARTSAREEEAVVFLRDHKVYPDDDMVTAVLTSKNCAGIVCVYLWKQRGQHDEALSYLQSVLCDETAQSSHSSFIQLTHDLIRRLAGSCANKQGDFYYSSDFIRKTIHELQNDAIGVEDLRSTERAIAAVAMVTYMRSLSLNVESEYTCLEKNLPVILHYVPSKFAVNTLTSEGNRAHYRLGLRLLQSLDVSDDDGRDTKINFLADYLHDIITQGKCADAEVHDAYWKNLSLLVFGHEHTDSDHHHDRQLQLHKFLESSMHLNLLTAKDFFEADEIKASSVKCRAIVYRRLKEHRRAIDMFLHESKSLTDAQAYALKAQLDDRDGSAYDCLLHQLLRPTTSVSPHLDEALLVLEQSKGADAIQALSFLEDGLDFLHVSTFLVNSLRRSTGERRALELGTSLEHSRANVLMETVSQAQRRLVVLDHPVCTNCSKSIRADSPLVIFPDDTVRHRMCTNI